jgi:hypothetical protein
MADSDLLYDPYTGYEVRRSSDVSVDSLSAGPDVDLEEVEGNSHPILSNM